MFKFKKILSLVLVVSMITVMSTNVFAENVCVSEKLFNSIEDITEDEVVAFCSDYLTDYYHYLFFRKSVELENYIVPNQTKEYLNLKYKLIDERFSNPQLVVSDLNLKFSLKSLLIDDNQIRTEIISNLTYNTNLFDTPSGRGEEFKIVLTLKDQKLRISDIYSKDFIDTFSMNLDSKIKTLSLINPLSKINELFIVESQIGVEEDTINDNIPTVKAPTSLMASTLTSLDTTAMVNYAKDNCSQESPSSGNSNVTYYDFSKITNNYDCTNFVSHALLAGGAPMYKPTTNPAANGWYYNKLSDRSPSWSSVKSLHTFLTRAKPSSTKGPAGTGKSYSASNCSEGDIVQIQYTTAEGWRHSVIVTETGTSDVSVTSRSSAKSFNYNESLAITYGSYTKRLINLSGYYN